MAMQVGFGGAFTRAFAVTRHHPSLPDARFLFYDTPRYGSSIHALRGHAVKRDETSHSIYGSRKATKSRSITDIKRNGRK
jgi:hypothetical protein